MTIRSGWAYLLAAVLTGTVACSSDNNNGGTGGSGGRGGAGGLGGHHTGGNGGGATAGAGGNGGNVTTGGAGIGGNATTGGGGNHGGAGNGGNHGGAGNGGNHGGGGNGGNGGAMALTDAQVAGVAYEANSGEVRMAQLAQTKSSNADVLQFAAMMIQDHGATITRLQQLLDSQNLTPADSPQRMSVTAMAEQTYNALFTDSGSTFDRSYAMSQVTMHQTFLTLLQQTLVPDAQNSALKTELQMEQTTVMAHLTMAQTLVSTLSSDGGTTHGDAGADAHH